MRVCLVVFALVVALAAALSGVERTLAVEQTGHAAAVVRRPGHVSGRVTDIRGLPIKNSQAFVHITPPGVLSEAIITRTDSHGFYDIEVPDFVYRIRAYSSIRYDNRKYPVFLHALPNGDVDETFESKNGIVRNFVLRIAGPIVLANCRHAGFCFYGGSMTIPGTGKDGFSELFFPIGGTVKATLTPEGPLLDGSRGRVLTFKFKIGQDEQLRGEIWDVPVGRYKITGSFTYADGRVAALQVAAEIRDADDRSRVLKRPVWGPAARIFFPPVRSEVCTQCLGDDVALYFR